MAVRVSWRQGCWAELRTLPGVMAELDKRADAIARRAGEGFGVRSARATGGRVRGRASVGTQTVAAMRRQAREHVLEKALGGS